MGRDVCVEQSRKLSWRRGTRLKEWLRDLKYYKSPTVLQQHKNTSTVIENTHTFRSVSPVFHSLDCNWKHEERHSIFIEGGEAERTGSLKEGCLDPPNCRLHCFPVCLTPVGHAFSGWLCLILFIWKDYEFSEYAASDVNTAGSLRDAEMQPCQLSAWQVS